MTDEHDAVEYLKQEDVKKINVINSKDYQGCITNPQSVIKFDKYEDDDLKIGDKVEFKLRESLEVMKGTIKCTGKANGISSSVVELVWDIDLCVNKFEDFLRLN